jgi:hypothetical protein
VGVGLETVALSGQEASDTYQIHLGGLIQGLSITDTGTGNLFGAGSPDFDTLEVYGTPGELFQPIWHKSTSE